MGVGAGWGIAERKKGGWVGGCSSVALIGHWKRGGGGGGGEEGPSCVGCNVQAK